MAIKKSSKNTVAKKPAAKKLPANKATATTKPKRITAVKEAFTKTEVIQAISEHSDLSKKEVKSVLDALGEIIGSHIKKRAVGKFTLPGLLKIEVKQKPATKARQGINPFTGEMTTFQAKPARRVVKVKALKKLKEMADS